MSIIRVGSTGRYADGWEHVFGGTKGRAGKAAGKAKGGRKAVAKTRSKAAGKKVATKASKVRRSRKG